MEKSVEKILVLTDTTIAAVHKSNRKRHEQCIGKPLQCIFNFLFRRRVINEKKSCCTKGWTGVRNMLATSRLDNTGTTLVLELVLQTNPDLDQPRENYYVSFVQSGRTEWSALLWRRKTTGFVIINAEISWSPRSRHPAGRAATPPTYHCLANYCLKIN